MAQQLALELSLDLGLVLKTDSAAARQATEKIGALRQKHMQLRWHFLKDLVHNGLIVIEKVPTLMNISDMLTKAVTRQILRRCLAQAESWRIDGERVDEEYVVEINMVETGLARRDRSQPVENDRWNYKIVLTLILVSAGVVICLPQQRRDFLSRPAAAAVVCTVSTIIKQNPPQSRRKSPLLSYLLLLAHGAVLFIVRVHRKLSNIKRYTQSKKTKERNKQKKRKKGVNTRRGEEREKRGEFRLGINKQFHIRLRTQLPNQTTAHSKAGTKKGRREEIFIMQL